MQLYSTKNKSHLVSLQEAVFRGLPPDNGLYMPTEIPEINPSFIRDLHKYSFQEISFEVAQTLLKGAIPENELLRIIEKAINFPAPLVQLDEQKYILELFHGPSLAFKDFGARFMAQLMHYFLRDENKELLVLVATSGDTGGAVAAGFFQTPGIRVVILYPSGKVSLLQEKQLTALGKNITAVEIEGSFDDCQALVKQAFLDETLTTNIHLSSANSINIARLIPQSFYYFEAVKQLRPDDDAPIVFSIPSGNFGNLTAGLFAKKMGLPIHQFIAATNANDVIPKYLDTGDFIPKASVATLSNAMDVGNPSNFDRMLDLYCSTWNILKEDISGYHFDDDTTKKAMREMDQNYHYTIDPHGAVGYLALQVYQKKHPKTRGIILETAHPSKFKDDVEQILSKKIDIPERLAVLSNQKKEAILLPVNFEKFKSMLLEKFSRP